MLPSLFTSQSSLILQCALVCSCFTKAIVSANNVQIDLSLLTSCFTLAHFSQEVARKFPFTLIQLLRHIVYTLQTRFSIHGCLPQVM